MPSALHSAKTAMVFPCKKRSAAEVFRPASQQQNRSFVMRDPQGLRRPRFSFFFSTCQTARRESVTSSGEERISIFDLPQKIAQE
jgi:hypothetical protein